MGVPAEWQTLMHRPMVVKVLMTSPLPPGPGELLVCGVPPDDRGPRGDHWRHHECQFLYI
jgi:hypothetical protein